MLSQYSVLDSLGVIKSLGFDGVEICVERKDWSRVDLDTLPVDAIREQVAELGLAPHVFSLHCDYIYQDDLFELSKKAIPMAPKLGTNIFVCSGCKVQTGDDAEWQRMAERTQVLVQIAEDNGVTLAKEFEPDFIVGTSAAMQRLLDEIPSPYFAANVDLGHVFICDPDPLEALARYGHKMVHGHISGMPIGLHDHLLPGEGDMNLAEYIAVLREMGFAGGLALDLYKYEYEEVAAQSVRVLHELLAAA